MARKTPSRLDKRREVEAVEALEKANGKKAKKKTTAKKKATKKKAVKRTRAKAKTSTRKRIVWCVFNGSMKEEGRYPYSEKAAADKKIQQLRTRSPKRMFFIQQIKEEVVDAPATDDE